MATLRTVEISITAGQQFLGTEVKVAPLRPGNALLFFEVNLKMGAEAKTWEIQKVPKGASGIILLQSVDQTTGAPTATTEQDVIGSREDVAVLLEAGDQIQIVTGAATSAMYAKLYFIEGTPTELLAMRGD